MLYRRPLLFFERRVDETRRAGYNEKSIRKRFDAERPRFTPIREPEDGANPAGRAQGNHRGAVG